MPPFTRLLGIIALSAGSCAEVTIEESISGYLFESVRKHKYTDRGVRMVIDLKAIPYPIYRISRRLATLSSLKNLPYEEGLWRIGARISG
jgi:hypothetical protein